MNNQSRELDDSPNIMLVTPYVYKLEDHFNIIVDNCF